jgi:hypothetical protein
LRDYFQHTFQILQYFVIPESQYAKSIALDGSASGFVVLNRFGMLPTVDLKHEHSFQTHEIYDKLADDVLPSKLESIDTALAQSPPQMPFRVSHFAAQ